MNMLAIIGSAASVAKPVLSRFLKSMASRFKFAYKDKVLTRGEFIWLLKSAASPKVWYKAFLGSAKSVISLIKK